MEDLISLFLNPDTLERVFLYMCKTAVTCADPITESVKAMLCNQIQFSVSRCGLGIIKGQPVFPYSFMTTEQRQWVYELVRAISNGDDHHSALARLDDPLTYVVENERIIFRGTTTLDAKVVFNVLLDCMFKSERDIHRIQLLNDLLLQRIGGRVQITRETLRHIQSRLEEKKGSFTNLIVP